MNQHEPRGESGGYRPGTHGTAWLADGLNVNCYSGRGAKWTYLSLGPTCRLDWSQCAWALARQAPQAEVVSGGHQPGLASSGAGYTWGALCRTRPLIFSRPGWERHLLRRQDAEQPSLHGAPTEAHPPLLVQSCKVLKRCHLHSSSPTLALDSPAE